jgi:hypothetical protein
MFANLLKELKEEREKTFLESDYEKINLMVRRQESIRGSLEQHDVILAALDQFNPEPTLVRLYQDAAAGAREFPQVQLTRKLGLNAESVLGGAGTGDEIYPGLNYELYSPGWADVRSAVLRLNDRNTDFWKQARPSSIKLIEDYLGKDFQFCLCEITWQLVLTTVTIHPRTAGELPESYPWGPYIEINLYGNFIIDNALVQPCTEANFKMMLRKRIVESISELKAFLEAEAKRAGDSPAIK